MIGHNPEDLPSALIIWKRQVRRSRGRRHKTHVRNNEQDREVEYAPAKVSVMVEPLDP